MSMFDTTVSRTPQKWLVCLCAIALVVCAGAAHAIGGYIYARTIIKSENGNPYWAAYDDKGQLAYGPTEAKGISAIGRLASQGKRFFSSSQPARLMWLSDQFGLCCLYHSRAIAPNWFSEDM